MTVLVGASLFFAGAAWGQGREVINLFDEVEGDGWDELEIEEGEGVQLEIMEGLRGQGQGVGSSRAIRLEYVRRGGSILVPLRVGTRDAYFVLDTGATYTTLTEEFARSAGVLPGPDTPAVTMQTAGGLRQSRFGLMNRLSVGGQVLSSVSFTLCDPCGGYEVDGKPVAGLLGLNVLERYRMSMEDGYVELVPTRDHSNRRADIEPWVEVAFEGTWVRSDRGRPEAQFTVRNHSTRQIRDLVVEMECENRQGERWENRAESGTLSAQGEQAVFFDGGTGGCAQFRMRVVNGRW